MAIASKLRHVTSDEDADALPQHSIGAFLPMCSHDIGMFNDFFADEIDSWMASSVACCDSCYDDFLAHWPGVAFRNLDFQRGSTDITLFFETSRMRDVYSPAEFSSLVNFVTCPRCDDIIRYNFWVFEHRFSEVEKIELAIEQLSELGTHTPFLLLEHPFAVEVLEAIRSHVKAIHPQEFPNKLYRARWTADILGKFQNPEDVTTFGPAPIEVVGEGRFNHAGNSVLYVADTIQTARLEIGGKEDEVFVACLKLHLLPSLVLDLTDLDEDLPCFDILNAISLSALLAAPHINAGWSKPQYVFSRFVADCARSAGFAAIRYGSTKDSEGSNYVLLEPLADFESRATLISISNGSSTSD
ncbi:RES family NAD+ phosphorylase [Brucella sp. BE17]|uniref:RES family NAD+ phosphorylase n=1 Tax=Brucella sp. BE17 TaxID=3142977 RepID=UPI0031BA0CBF